MYEIIPSPGTEDKEWSAIEKKIESVRSFAKTIHIDICDGKFAPNVTFADPAPFAKYAKDFFLEVHLMVEEPIHLLKPWAAAGFRRFIGQIEKMPDQAAFVAQAELLGEVGLAIDGPTQLKELHIPYADLDVVLLYTGDKAGFSGKPFQPDRLDKVKMIRHELPYLPIEIDGGVNGETIQTAARAGVNRFVVTSFLFNSSSPAGRYEVLRQQLEDVDEPTPHV